MKILLLEDEKLAAQKMGVSTKDRWNPMDIVMVKTGKESIIKNKIQKIADGSGEKEEKLVKLNIYMAELLTKKDMIPISLKGLTKNAKEGIISFAEGDEQRMMLMGLKRFTKYYNMPNVVALRTQIANKLNQENAYCF